jgi:phosphoesterase RecJ-like protein
MQNVLAKLKGRLDEAQRVLILLHLYPDGDTICSSLALARYLEQKGKQVDCAAKQAIPEVFQYLPGVKKIRTDFLLGDYDVVIAVDCGDTARTGFPIRLEQISKNRTLINIDHHSRNGLQKIASINLIDESAAATAEIVWDFLEFARATVDCDIATYVLAGIYYDTGGFQHSNVSSRTLEITSECLHLGGRMGLISEHINISKTSQSLKLWGLALKRMRFKDNGVVFSFLTQDDMREIGAKDEDAAGVINLMNTIDGARLAILFVETSDGTIKASLRTESDDVDVADLARVFGGGGHKKAAGFCLEGSFEKTADGWRVRLV